MCMPLGADGTLSGFGGCDADARDVPRDACAEAEGQAEGEEVSKPCFCRCPRCGGGLVGTACSEHNPWPYCSCDKEAIMACGSSKMGNRKTERLPPKGGKK